MTARLNCRLMRGPLLLALAVSAAGAQAGQDVDDLALIPVDAQEFLAVRVADLWKTPAFRQALASARKRDPKLDDSAAPEKEFGLRPADVERLSFVVADADKRDQWAVVRTADPYDAGKVLSRLTGARRRTLLGKPYTVGTHRLSADVAVWLAGPRVLVAGREEGVKRCITLAARKAAEGMMRPVLDLCKGKAHIVAGLDGKGLDGAGGPSVLSWLTPARLGWATVEVARGTRVAVHAEVADEKRAVDLRLTLLPLAKETFNARVKPWWGMDLAAMTEQRGRTVVARYQDGGGIIDLLVRLAANPAFLFDDPPLVQSRGPFGPLLVEEREDFTGFLTRRLLRSGIMHASQFPEEGLRDHPLSYYHRTGPVGQVFRACNTDPGRAVAVLDLGAGTMASYGLPGQTVDFYELDPDQARLCFDTDEYFTYVEDARARGVNVGLVLGDCRATFAPGKTNRRLLPLNARKGKPAPERKHGAPVGPDFKYRLIVVDTLSADAFPRHLVAKTTREAVQAYFGRLEEDGVVLLHVSNRYFDLLPPLANLTDDLGVTGYHLDDDNQGGPGKNHSHWLALTRKPGYFAKVLSAPRWARDPDQLMFLGAAAWPSCGSSALQSISGLSHTCGGVADLLGLKAHQAEGRPGDPRMVPTGWEPLETTAELRRLQAEGPKEVRALTERIDALKKSRGGMSAGWRDDRLTSLEETLRALRRRLERAPARLRLNAQVGVWTDRSSDLLSVFAR